MDLTTGATELICELERRKGARTWQHGGGEDCPFVFAAELICVETFYETTVNTLWNH